MPAHPAELRALVAGVDQGALVAEAARHGLSAIFAEDLSRAAIDLCAPWGATLARDAQAVFAAALKLRRLTLATVDAFAEKGVEAVLLKGYGLASRLYPQPLARVASDVDVWVRPPDRQAAGAALHALGLHPANPAGFAEDFDEPHDVYAGAAGMVEVHFTPAVGPGGAAFPDAELWKRAVSAQLDGRRVRYLAPEDEFVFLAAHAANHAFLRASWLVDLQRYLTAYQLDWARVAGLARQSGFATAVASALEVLERALRVDVSSARRALPARPWQGLVNGRLFSPRLLASARLAQGRVSAFLLRLWLVDSPARAVRHLRDGAGRLVKRLGTES